MLVILFFKGISGFGCQSIKLHGPGHILNLKYFGSVSVTRANYD